MLCYVLVSLILEFTVGYSDGDHWKLAYNIHPSDGHSFGYRAGAWEDDSDVGSDSTAFVKDYKSYDATQQEANYIAVVRHQNGVCEAARVWKFLESGKTLHQYLDSQVTTRLIATHDTYTFSYVSPGMSNKEKDPFFAVDGGIAFNWQYSDNGVRIANSEFYCGSGLPDANRNSDDYWGLGNDFCTTPSLCWSDVTMTRCSKWQSQGTDHGTHSYIKGGDVLGQYAVYVSDEDGAFPCEGIELQTSMYDFVPDFERVDITGDGVLTFEEFVFDVADTDRDGQLSLEEYSDARLHRILADTGVDSDTKVDFDRIDKDDNGFLNLFEIQFEIADSNNDGVLPYSEYYLARAGNNLISK